MLTSGGTIFWGWYQNIQIFFVGRNRYVTHSLPSEKTVRVYFTSTTTTMSVFLFNIASRFNLLHAALLCCKYQISKKQTIKESRRDAGRNSRVVLQIEVLSGWSLSLENDWQQELQKVLLLPPVILTSTVQISACIVEKCCALRVFCLHCWKQV